MRAICVGGPCHGEVYEIRNSHQFHYTDSFCDRHDYRLKDKDALVPELHYLGVTRNSLILGLMRRTS